MSTLRNKMFSCIFTCACKHLFKIDCLSWKGAQNKLQQCCWIYMNSDVTICIFIWLCHGLWGFSSFWVMEKKLRERFLLSRQSEYIWQCVRIMRSFKCTCEKLQLFLTKSWLGTLSHWWHIVEAFRVLAFIVTLCNLYMCV